MLYRCSVMRVTMNNGRLSRSRETVARGRELMMWRWHPSRSTRYRCRLFPDVKSGIFRTEEETDFFFSSKQTELHCDLCPVYTVTGISHCADHTALLMRHQKQAVVLPRALPPCLLCLLYPLPPTHTHSSHVQAMASLNRPQLKTAVERRMV